MDRCKRYSAFTVIELLVVIAIIAVMMAVLMPSLNRSRRQAKDLICQSKLKQWGLIFSMYTQDNQDRLPTWLNNDTNLWPTQFKQLWLYYHQTGPLFLCPRATKPNQMLTQLGHNEWSFGSTFTAWTLVNKQHQVRHDSSYGTNHWGQYPQDDAQNKHLYWKTALVKNASKVPQSMDSMSCWANTNPNDPRPPLQEDQWSSGSLESCINRHEGFINSLFMDWSVRSVGLKDLWILRWHREFNTSGPWTQAGGVTPDDWPEWMRGI